MGQPIATTRPKLFARDAYRDYLEVHGLSVQLTEALAEYWHRRIREELTCPTGPRWPRRTRPTWPAFFLDYRGCRYSFGYPACPDLEDRAKIVATAGAGPDRGELSEEFQLTRSSPPTPSSSHHPEAKYFNA